MANNKHLLEWLIVVSISTASTFFAESALAPAVGLNTTSPEAVAACKQIPHLEDYECDDYVKSMHKSLESKFERENDNTKDWALISFIINRDGTIAKETVSNSTGNDEFNSQAG